MSLEAISNKQEVEKDFSAYMTWMQHQKGTYAFLCGFTFTALTLLIINLPNPNAIREQVIMLFLTIVFDIFLFLIILIGAESLQFCKDIPPYIKSLKLCNALSDVGFVLWGFSIPLIYLLWDMVYLALLSTIIWIIITIISNYTVRKPFEKYRGITKSRE